MGRGQVGKRCRRRVVGDKGVGGSRREEKEGGGSTGKGAGKGKGGVGPEKEEKEEEGVEENRNSDGHTPPRDSQFFHPEAPVLVRTRCMCDLNMQQKSESASDVARPCSPNATRSSRMSFCADSHFHENETRQESSTNSSW